MSSAQILQVFKSWDKRGDGTIAPEELRKVLQALDPKTWTGEAVAKLMEEMTSNDGKVHYNDFVKWAMGDGAVIERMLGGLVSPHQYSSTVIEAPAFAVWELVRPLTFKWMNDVASASKDQDSDLVNVAYQDNTVQTIQELEYSDLDMCVQWELVASEPAAPTFSAVHTMRCHRLTSSNHCFLSWNTDFSNDCTVGVIEDCKWKKADSFRQLQAFMPPGPGPAASQPAAGDVVSPHQFESALIRAPASTVFALVKPLTFKWMHSVARASRDEGQQDLVSVAYADNTVQRIHQVERSTVDMKVAWELLESDPPAPTFSAVHTITCHKVLTTDECVISWNTDFSSDCTPAVLEDCKFKKVDSFEQLQAFVSKPGS